MLGIENKVKVEEKQSESSKAFKAFNLLTSNLETLLRRCETLRARLEPVTSPPLSKGRTDMEVENNDKTPQSTLTLTVYEACEKVNISNDILIDIIERLEV